MFDLDPEDTGIELPSQILPGVTWHFNLEGAIYLRPDDQLKIRNWRSLCYWFHTDNEQLPGADNAIAAALLALTNEEQFTRVILTPHTTEGSAEQMLRRIMDVGPAN